MKVFFFLLFATISFAGVDTTYFNDVVNRYGYGDTTSWTDTLNSAEVWYSKVYSLTDYEDITCLLKVGRQTTKVRWGYQPGLITKNSSGVRKVKWASRICLDTMTTDSLGKSKEGRVDSTGVLFRPTKIIDSTIAGYYCQDVWFVPEWREVIRFFIMGMSGNYNAANTYIIEPHRRNNVKTSK